MRAQPTKKEGLTTNRYNKDTSDVVDEEIVVVRDLTQARQYNGQKRRGGRNTMGQQIITGALSKKMARGNLHQSLTKARKPVQHLEAAYEEGTDFMGWGINMNKIRFRFMQNKVDTHSGDNLREMDRIHAV